MGIEMIIGLATALLAVIAGAFGIGHARGTSKAEAKADQQRTEENAAATVAAAERKAEVTKGASDVQQTLSVCLMTMLIASCAKVYPPR
jgi:hypothetical protein